MGKTLIKCLYVDLLRRYLCLLFICADKKFKTRVNLFNPLREIDTYVHQKLFWHSYCKLVPSNASEVLSDSTRKDLGRILTPNLQAINELQSKSVFNFITSESHLKILRS